jgi:hypothetical protein
MPPKGHVKDCSRLGSVVQHFDKWRVELRLGTERIRGPARASAAEAAADLTRARALPRQQISAFFNGLRDQLPVESTSCSSTAPGSANQRSPTDPTSGKRPVSDELATSPAIKKPRGDDVCVTPSGPYVQPNSCSDAAAGSQSECVHKNIAGLSTIFSVSGSGKRSEPRDLASSPADQKLKTDGEEVCGTPSGALATPTPTSKRRRLGDAGCVDNLGSPPRSGKMTPSMATKLAQSCRKSPMVPTTPRTPHISAPSPSAQRDAARAAEAAEVARLLSLAQPATAKLFAHVRAQEYVNGISEFLPKASDDRGAYNQLSYLSAKHKHGELQCAAPSGGQCLRGGGAPRGANLAVELRSSGSRRAERGLRY